MKYRGVLACAADQHVVAWAAVQAVVATPAVQDVGCGVARQQVVAVAAVGVFNHRAAGQHQAVASYAADGRTRQVERHRVGACRSVQRVYPRGVDQGGAGRLEDAGRREFVRVDVDIVRRGWLADQVQGPGVELPHIP